MKTPQPPKPIFLNAPAPVGCPKPPKQMTDFSETKNFALIITCNGPAIVRWFGSLTAAQAAQRNHARGSSQMASYVIVSEEQFNSY